MNDFSDVELAFMLGTFVGVCGMFIAVSFVLAIECVGNWLDGKRAKRDRMLSRFEQASFDAETEKRKR